MRKLILLFAAAFFIVSCQKEDVHIEDFKNEKESSITSKSFNPDSNLRVFGNIGGVEIDDNYIVNPIPEKNMIFIYHKLGKYAIAFGVDNNTVVNFRVSNINYKGAPVDELSSWYWLVKCGAGCGPAEGEGDFFFEDGQIRAIGWYENNGCGCGWTEIDVTIEKSSLTSKGSESTNIRIPVFSFSNVSLDSDFSTYYNENGITIDNGYDGNCYSSYYVRNDKLILGIDTGEALSDGFRITFVVDSVVFDPSKISSIMITRKESAGRYHNYMVNDLNIIIQSPNWWQGQDFNTAFDFTGNIIVDGVTLYLDYEWVMNLPDELNYDSGNAQSLINIPNNITPSGTFNGEGPYGGFDFSIDDNSTSGVTSVDKYQEGEYFVVHIHVGESVYNDGINDLFFYIDESNNLIKTVVENYNEGGWDGTIVAESTNVDIYKFSGALYLSGSFVLTDKTAHHTASPGDSFDANFELSIY